MSGSDIDISRIYALLYARYGERHWWPAKTPYEVVAGAILTQNANWGNVEKALARFPGGITPQMVAQIDDESLEELIRPAGFFRQKAGYLKTVTAWYGQYGYAAPEVRRQPLARLRAELLALRGVGRETADSILLYAFGLPSFVIDAYTLRQIKRLTAGPGPLPYEEAKALFEAALDAGQYNNAHALMVENAKEHCRARPVCAGCPLREMCAEADK